MSQVSNRRPITKKKPKKRKKSTAKASAWKWMSRYIRMKAADQNGYAECVTCGAVKHWKDLDAGHFHSKNKGNSAFFLEENVHCQCVTCNRFQDSNGPRFSVYMREMYGDEFLESLDFQVHQVVKHSLADLEDFERYYKAGALIEAERIGEQLS